MPYIPQNDRNELYDSYDGNHYLGLNNAGKLNFLLTELYLRNDWKDVLDLRADIWFMCMDYLRNTERRYQNFNDVVGALVCSKLEFELRFKDHPRFDDVVNAISEDIDNLYKKVITPYEKDKITANGDVRILYRVQSKSGS